MIIFKEIIEAGEEFQKIIEKEDGYINQNYTKIFNNFNKILKMNKSNNNDNLNNKLKYMKFCNENELSVKDYLNKISNLNIIYRIIKFNKDRKQNNSVKNKIKKEEKILIEKKNLSIQYNHKMNENRKKTYYNNIKNISCDNLYDNKNNDSQNGKFFNKNNSLSIKENNYFIQNNLNNHFKKIRNKTNNSLKSQNDLNKTPLLRTNFEGKYTNKRTIRTNKISHINNNSLLESYFELKDKEKCISLNNCDNFSVIEKRVESQKNSKSFNNLNILNNFYNLDYTKRSPNYNIRKKNIIHHFNTNKNFENRKLKIGNDTLNRLIPETFKKFNLNYK